jgi:uncharacterized protein YndB with AHSA1/START domain
VKDSFDRETEDPMKTLHYEISINAEPRKVWETMLEKETYIQWTDAGWPGSSYHGEWKQGASIRFTGEDGGGGTLAEITEYQPYSRVAARHVAILTEDGGEDRESDMAKGWIGTREEYTFTAENGSTKIEVDLTTNPEWASMFDEGWPKALEALKALAEN